MFKSISDSIRDWPVWARNWERYKRLDVLDRVLAGGFYDHLRYGFHQESEANNDYIPIIERRPSARFNMPLQVAKRCARKLFAGRQKPRFVCDDESVVEAADALAKEGFFEQRMLHAAVDGSVGSVATTFKILPDPDKKQRIVFDIWHAKHCVPIFDVLGELTLLRVQYTCSGVEFLNAGVLLDSEGEDVRAGMEYWYICDHTTEDEVLYLPIPVTRWDPQTPPLGEPVEADARARLGGSPVDPLVVDATRTSRHALGFVPGHWFINLSGGEMPDGACTWLPAVDISILLDYTLSQLGRGLWYNAAPQLVTKGDLKNFGYENGRTTVRGPANMLQFEADRKDPLGNTMGGGDAHLLEMTGAGLREGREYVEQLRKLGLEAIQASRKDPDKLAGAAMSGKAMEMLEEDFLDLTQELRTSWGEQGSLPLMKKALRAALKVGHEAAEGVSEDAIEQLTLQWPKPYTPSAQEFVFFSQALLSLTAPVPMPGEQKVLPGEPAPKGADGKPGAPGKPTVMPPATQPGLLTVPEARALLEMFVDIPRIEDGAQTQQQKPVAQGSQPGPAGAGPNGAKQQKGVTT